MTVHEPGSAWYLAQLKPNAARIADRNLKRQGFQTFLPLVEETRQRRGKYVAVEQPLFPGYIFVAFDVRSGHWPAVNSTLGITRLVSFGKAPARVPRDLVSQLMLRCEASGKLLPPKFLSPGDKVRVTQGPFAAFVAEIENIAPDRRVSVLLNVLGGRTRVTLGPDQLRAI